MKATILTFLAFLLTATLSCGGELARLTVDISPFIHLGCVRVEAQRVGEGDCCYTKPAHVDCSAATLETKYECGRIEEVPDYYGGLNPKVAILECVYYGAWDKPTNDGIRYIGAGWLPVYEKFLVFTESRPKLLNNSSEFREFFAPVESEQEAFSYAAALTGSYPLFDIKIPSGYKREAKEIRSTSAEEVTDGWKVHLFNYQLGGCGPHHYYSIDYLVTRDGNVTELSRENVWRDPAEDNLCVD